MPEITDVHDFRRYLYAGHHGCPRLPAQIKPEIVDIRDFQLIIVFRNEAGDRRGCRGHIKPEIMDIRDFHI